MVQGCRPSWWEAMGQDLKAASHIVSAVRKQSSERGTQLGGSSQLHQPSLADMPRELSPR